MIFNRYWYLSFCLRLWKMVWLVFVASPSELQDPKRIYVARSYEIWKLHFLPKFARMSFTCFDFQLHFVVSWSHSCFCLKTWPHFSVAIKSHDRMNSSQQTSSNCVVEICIVRLGPCVDLGSSGVGHIRPSYNPLDRPSWWVVTSLHFNISIYTTLVSDASSEHFLVQSIDAVTLPNEILVSKSRPSFQT